jgi:type III restriction enzyme
MQLKTYQQETLTALEGFLTFARAEGPEAAFARFNQTTSYMALNGLKDVPYVCLRLPTGGGKTLLAARSIKIAGEAFLDRDRPITLWMVPTDTIKKQTVEALKDKAHPYRQMLDDAFDSKVRVFDITEFDTIRPKDIEGKVCVIVSTIQAFRVNATDKYTVYKHHEMLEDHFQKIPENESMERVSAEEANAKGLTEGALKYSFANLMHYHRPLMIVDEAHNAVSELSVEVQRRLRPGAIIEFTATPRTANNILHSVTATALKNEEMIKLPIRVKAHASWQEAVSASVAERRRLAERGKLDKKRIRPIVLYQAQPGNSEASPEGIKEFLIKQKLIPAHTIAIATGTQRELHGINLKDPNRKIEHVITIEALKEGWDCPTAYVLCATQKISSETKIEQLLGRVLRMPYAERRVDPALNQAYSHVSEPSFAEVGRKLRDKLIDMGFTDEEASSSLKSGGIQRNSATGDLFAQDDETEVPVYQVTVPDTPESREALEASNVEGVEIFENEDGTITAGVSGDISDDAEAAIMKAVPADESEAVKTNLKAHRQMVEAAKSPAQKGVTISVPGLKVWVQGEMAFADDDSIFEVNPWSLEGAPTGLTESDLKLNRDENLITIDVRNEKVVYEDKTDSSSYLPGMERLAADYDVATFVSWLETKCRNLSINQSQLSAWLAAVISDLMNSRSMNVADLVDWQFRIATAIKEKLRKIETERKSEAFQLALFDNDAKMEPENDRFLFGDGIFGDSPRHPLHGRTFSKHLLGEANIPLMDGKEDGEEFQCAIALNGLDEVDVWVRNVANHADAFRLTLHSGGKYYPDFIAKLNDGRIFVVEYKGSQGSDRDDTRKKALVANLWAQKTGNVYAVIEKMKHGHGMAAQMLEAIRSKPH